MPLRVRNNVIANYVSQFAISVLAIIMLPIYLRMIGAEGYGLIGFFAMLQVWFGLLDIGLSATMGREAARFNGGVVQGRRFRELLRAMEWLFVAVALVAAVSIAAGADYLASEWLQNQSLSDAEVSAAISTMGGILALRWLGGLFRGVISGFERQVWLGVYNILFNAFRYVGVVPVLLYFGPTVSNFFSYQLLVAIVELLAILGKAYSLLPRLGQPLGWRVNLRPIVPMLRFSLAISFVGLVWALVTQSDKLVLSRLLSLADYGLFAMAASAASGVMLFSSPISSAIQPRLARLHAEENDAALLTLYRTATRVISVVVFPVAVMLAFFSEDALWIWTGDHKVSNSIAQVFALYVLGNAVLAVASFPYYLQFAKGDMKLHIYGSVVLLISLVPAIVMATVGYGMNGAGWAWLSVNACYLLFWVPIVHRRFAPGMHANWLLGDVGVPVVTSTLAALGAWLFLPDSASRVGLALLLTCTGVVVFCVTAMSVRQARDWITSTGKSALVRLSEIVHRV